MSAGGQYGYWKFSRKLLDHKYARERRTYSRFEALIWLLNRTAFAEHTVTSNGHVVVIPRGHVLTSVRFLAGQFQWSKGKVTRFLDDLVHDATLETVIETPLGTLYLFVNYESYQDSGEPAGQQAGQQSGRQRDTDEDSNGTSIIKGNKGKSLSADRKNQTHSLYSTEFELCWAIYPSRPNNPKKAAYKAWVTRVHAGATEAELLAGTQRYRAYCDAEGLTGTKYVKQASTFYGPEEYWKEPWVIAGVASTSPDQSHRSVGQSLSDDPDWLRKNGFPVVLAGAV